MILFSTQESKEGTDGDFCKAVGQPAGLDISRFDRIVIVGHLIVSEASHRQMPIFTPLNELPGC
ncbi:MAG: hypothetical protein DMG70_22690 [Acidobacteria bacterium]|nr:MAG: hypothetical protein DMG70_22690 [Acidobacteriota bacterium]